jgi:ribosomal protein S24E
MNSDILHPGRANISKTELSEKIGSLYKAQKEQVQVFGLRTHFGGGKTTGFALIYDSPEALKKFEPKYRLIRVGLATKPERASRQQRTSTIWLSFRHLVLLWLANLTFEYRQAAQEPTEDPARNRKGQGCQGEEGEINAQSFKWLLAGAGRGARAWRCGTGHDCAPASAADFFLGIKKNLHVFVDGTSRNGFCWDGSPSHGVCLRYTSMKSTVFSGLRSKSVSYYLWISRHIVLDE